MTSTQTSTARSALGIGVSVAVVAAGVALTGATAAGAAAALTAGAAPASSAPAGVRATVVRAAAPAGSVGQGSLGAGDCTLAASGASSCDIYARVGTATVHNSATTTTSVPFWSFATSASGPATGRSAVLVGTVGQPITITLHNQLTNNVGLAVPQVDGLAADTTGIAPGDSHPYTFTPARAGTYTYQASLTPNGPRQVAMGLAGALIVRPAAGSTDSYDLLQSTFDDEAVLVYADIDPKLGAAPDTFNMRDFNPSYHFINGVSYPDTSEISTDGGRTLMLHFVNGSQLEKSPTLLGTRMAAFARGARPLPTTMTVSGRVVDPGDTLDATITPPVGQDARYSLFTAPEGDFHQAGLTNTGWINGTNSPALGGAMTFIKSGGAAGVLPSGPLVTALGVAGQPGSATAVPPRALTASATFDTTGRGTGDIADAEYFIDTLGAVTTGLPITWTPTAGTPLVTTWPIDVTGLTDGVHSVWVRGRDSFGAWGPARSASITVDNHGPTVSSVALDSPAVNGTVDLNYTATASDSATGGSTVTEARAWVDVAPPADAAPTAYLPVTTNGPRVTAAATGTVSIADLAALPVKQGAHTLFLQAKDVLGQWGTPTATPFVFDTTAPTTTAITLRPPATNGLSSNPAKPGTIGIAADVLDPVTDGVSSRITTVEAYLTKVDPTGSVSGIQLAPVPVLPGAAAGTTRWAADMPLSWIGGFTTSTTVPVWVVGIDAAGNRGPGLVTTLLIDKEKPGAVTAASAVQGVGFPGDAAVALAGVAVDTAGPFASGIAGGEWFVGPDPGAGRGTPLTATPGAGGASNLAGTVNLNTINRVVGGALTVNLRAKDAAGNFGPITSVTIALRPVTIFADGFDSGTLPGAWTAQTALRGGALAVPTAGALAGSNSLLVTTPADQDRATGYVTKDMAALRPVVGARFSAHFTFAAGTTGTNGATTVFSGRSATGVNTLQVQYSRAGGNVRFRVGVATGAVNRRPANQAITWSGWAAVTAATSYAVQVDLTGATLAGGGGAVLRVNQGTTTTSVRGNTNAFRVSAARLGIITTEATRALSFRFDSYSSARVPF